MRILGLDIGMKRTGVALSDTLGISVRALDNISPRPRREDDIQAVLALCEAYEVEAVVVGYPLMPQSGDEGPMGRRCRRFAQVLAYVALQKDKNLPVFLVDERNSSKDAQARLVESGIKKSKRKAALDSEAARVMVETFLSMSEDARDPAVEPSNTPD
ncbi:MAG: Holliday junction resolvase RuvX [Deltaproteobacteria bacterium]|nr:Holliday junction resolvase RuvX [Deltaproteobacteria bacterium]